jgi:hypothetical protein
VLRSEMVEFVARRPATQALLADMRDLLFDDAEEVVRDAVIAQVPWAVRRVLTTLGADRGYGPNPKPAVAAEPASPTTVPAANAGQQPPAAAAPVQVATPAIAGPSDATIRDALVRAKWHLTRAATLLNMPRGRLTLLIAGRPALSSLAIDERESLVDDAETALWLAVRDKERWACLFMMDTLGRDKGYSRRGRRPVENLTPLPGAPANAAATAADNARTLPAATTGSDQGDKLNNTGAENARKDQSSSASPTAPQPGRTSR